MASPPITGGCVLVHTLDEVVAGGTRGGYRRQACDSGDFGAGQPELFGAELQTGRRQVGVRIAPGAVAEQR